MDTEKLCILYAYKVITHTHVMKHKYDVFITQWRDEFQNII